jgi:uncharacterized protein YutE (UPF0331/DUF86 family)
MSPIVERLAELRQHLDHLGRIRPRVTSADVLRGDLSLRNDVLHSLQTVCQVVIDVAAELSARRGERFEDYTEAVRNLGRDPRFSPLVTDLAVLPGFRNVLVHEYVTLDLDRVVQALDGLAPIENFLRVAGEVAREDLEARGGAT